ncbi:type II toxin-antitoxin system RelE/ParE family toxin [Candidatus Sumerlaeota bacterium]|nr:type II toxin-antitoxin system RelE/ParE family toxin [Planctomycetota bacterium]MBI3735288.1 type II toxin-antitoxin system RelE/ParE family toxin [Candidatus Sumerlaeota bacterium]
MEIVRTSSFWRDLKGLIDYFDQVHAEAAAVRFIDAVDETIDFIADFPDLGSSWESSRPRREGMRWRLVKGFENYLILYRRNQDRVYVMRVVDGRRNFDELFEGA